MTNLAVETDLDHLRQDIALLRQDVASLAGSLRSLAKERGHDAAGRVEELAGRAKKKASELEHAAEHGLAERPLASVLGSFGLGFLLGVVLDPKR